MVAFRRLLAALALLLGLGATAARAVTLSQITVSDVTTSGFTVAWVTSAPSTPALAFFTNAEGTIPLAVTPRVEFTPLALGSVEAETTFETRAQRRALAQLVAGRNLAVARVSGLPRGTTVYFRPRSLVAPGGAENTTGTVPVTGVDLATRTEFVADAQLLAVDFPGAGASGLVAVLRGPAGTVPLTAVVGDGPFPDRALFNLADLVSSALRTNAAFSAPVQFTISLMGQGATGATATHTVTFQVGTRVGAFGTYVFTDTGSAPAYFTFDTIPAQDAGLAFRVTIRAMAANGQPLTTYAGTVSITGSGAIAQGAGETALFTAGVLADYPVRIDRAGQFTLTASRSASTGSSNAFTVRDSFGAWRNANFNASQQADPAQSGLTADFNAAGIPNLLRYAFATGVANPDRSRLPIYGLASAVDGDRLTITFRRLPYAADLAYRVEASNDLNTWTHLQTVLPGVPESVTVTDTQDFGTPRARYLRVVVEEVPSA